MLLPAPPLFPRKRRLRAKARRTAPPAALTLVAATYDAANARVDLVFDRPVSIAGINVVAIVVNDPVDSAFLLAGASASLLDPATVRVLLAEDGDATGEQVLLTASAASGIVAVDDGGTWAGVMDVELPFP